MTGLFTVISELLSALLTCPRRNQCFFGLWKMLAADIWYSFFPFFVFDKHCPVCTLLSELILSTRYGKMWTFIPALSNEEYVGGAVHRARFAAHVLVCAEQRLGFLPVYREMQKNWNWLSREQLFTELTVKNAKITMRWITGNQRDFAAFSEFRAENLHGLWQISDGIPAATTSQQQC